MLFVSQTIEVKKNLTLTVKVTGKPEPEIKWFTNGKEIKPTFKIKMTKDKEVATLNITGVTLNMTGEYKVVATNPAGTTEHTAKINVCGEYNDWKGITVLHIPKIHIPYFPRCKHRVLRAILEGYYNLICQNANLRSIFV